ncbi:hypothetical protein BpHYR1_025055 [Brachionus plicatilis]|uniref:Uncharacterized protein n=1 Tax=Brachionus plicatilis TaxID=10195 RepID=A0A3M7SE74_BRAPC|nr:hypothetical protein BpHYR1_025055 [Brachionus plicatilis]
MQKKKKIKAISFNLMTSYFKNVSNDLINFNLFIFVCFTFISCKNLISSIQIVFNLLLTLNKSREWFRLIRATQLANYSNLIFILAISILKRNEISKNTINHRDHSSKDNQLKLNK